MFVYRHQVQPIAQFYWNDNKKGRDKFVQKYQSNRLKRVLLFNLIFHMWLRFWHLSGWDTDFVSLKNEVFPCLKTHWIRRKLHFGDEPKEMWYEKKKLWFKSIWKASNIFNLTYDKSSRSVKILWEYYYKWLLKSTLFVENRTPQCYKDKSDHNPELD